MRAASLAALLLAGCSNLLGIHPLDDAAGPGDDAPRDGAVDDGPRDAPIDGPPDAPPDANNGQVIGEHEVLSGHTVIQGSYIVARRFIVNDAKVAIGAGTHLKGETANARIRFAIYSDNAMAPFTRRVVTADVTLDGTPGYNEATLGPHNLPVGAYWIVMATEATLTISSLDTNNVTGAAASLPYTAALPPEYNPQPQSSMTHDRINLYVLVQP